MLFVRYLSNINYELVAPFGYSSFVTGVIRRGKDVLNHIAYITNAFDEDAKRLRTEGMVPSDPVQTKSV